MSPMSVAAMQHPRRPPPRATRACLPALLLLLRSSSLATPVAASPRSECSPFLHRASLRTVNATKNVAAENVAEQTVMGLPTRLDCRQQLQNGQRFRSFLLVCGAGAQDVFKSPWPTYPSLSVLSSAHGRSSGQIRCSSHSSVWNRSSPSANASVDSGEAQTIEQLWERYFADPFQWWDLRVDKKNSRSPDFKHKMTKKGLWIDGWSTPAWVKARLKLVTQGRLQSRAGHGTRDYQATEKRKRQPESINGEKSTVPESAGELRQSVEGGGGRMHVQSASTTIEAIAILKSRLEQGIGIDSYMYVEVLKRCLKQKDLAAAKEVHDCIIKSRMDQNTYVANNLLNVYIGCRRLQDARQVFDRLVKKNVISWTIMIGGYAQHNHAKDAMEVYNQMRNEGAQPNQITYMSILKACASQLALKWGKEIHADIRHGGMESDERVGTALLQMYAKCGCLKEARHAFDILSKHDLFSWTAMIGAYAESGCGVEAYQLFLQMIREGIKPDAITFMSILNGCASAGALEWVKEVHSQALEAGFASDLRVGSALVHMYAKNGSVDDARLVFDRMEERHVITWNVMIGAYAKSGCGVDAYRLFLQMIRERVKPDPVTYMSILNATASAGALEWVKDVHMHVLEAGYESDLRVGNAFVHMYAKSGSIDDARLVFDRMVARDLITWNVMIGAYAESGGCVEAYRLFLQMIQEGFKPDAITYVSILNATASGGALEWVKEIHNHAQDAGFVSDVRVSSALVHMYAKSDSVADARLVFDRMGERNVITWTAMIGAYAESGCGVEAYQLFLQMIQEGFKPNAITVVSILNACASAGALEWVKEVHSRALKAGLESDVIVGNALVHMYAKSGSIDDARVVFDGMEERNVITWTAMIGGLAQHGCGHEALEVFRKMIEFGVKPDGTSFVAVLSACSHAGLLDDGRRLFLAMTQDHGIEPSVVHCNCMVDLLGRAGHLVEAELFIGNMPVRPNESTWGALLGACRTYGNVELGELAAKELLKLDPKDASAYVLLSNIYAAGGKWDMVSLVRSVMQERGIRKEPGGSWIEVDNKIHRFVAGDTSHPETKEIYDEVNRLTERIKAEGYIPDTRLVLQNIDEEDKELSLCSHSEKLAIAYGLMHSAGGEPIRIFKNLRVCSDCHTATKFISKVTGREIMARDAIRFHHFKDGVCSCGDYW